MDRASFAAALARLREQAGYRTQAAASRATGVSPQALTRYESGKRFPTVPALLDYLESLGLTAHDLADALDQVNGRQPLERPTPGRDLDISHPPERGTMPLTALSADEVGAAVGAAVADVLKRFQRPSD